LILLVSCSNDNVNNLTKVRLNEVAHTVFYAPQYVAIEKGFFTDEGIDLILSVGNGADKSMTAILAGEADIALMGTEAGLYVESQKQDSSIKAFLQLTQKAGNFLVSKDNNKDFTWDKVRGKTILGGRPGGMPQMILEYILKSKGIDPINDVNMITNVQYGSTAQAFVGSGYDYTVEFDPVAFNLEKQNLGTVVAAIGNESSEVPYTVYFANTRFINEEKSLLQKFTNALHKGQMWLHSHEASEIAQVIQPQFLDMDIDDLIYIIDRYKSLEIWSDVPVIDEEAFDLLQDIIIVGGELKQKISYDKLVDTSFAKQAMLDVYNSK
jgi:NitT/TauT family transport system substrate-binding protein